MRQSAGGRALALSSISAPIESPAEVAQSTRGEGMTPKKIVAAVTRISEAEDHLAAPAGDRASASCEPPAIAGTDARRAGSADGRIQTAAITRR